MNTDAITIETDKQDRKSNIQDSNEETNKINLGLCMSAGIETATDADQSRFQRRHFPNKMTSNIFFSDLPPEDNVSSNNITNGEKKFSPAGNDTRYTDIKQSERRHFHSSSENFVQPENNVSSNNSADGEKSFSSAENDTQFTDQKQSVLRHFHSSSENFVQPENNGDRDEEVDSSETAVSTEVETDDTDQKSTQRRHFHEKTSSNIFFSGLPPEDISRNRTDPSDFRKRKGDGVILNNNIR